MLIEKSKSFVRLRFIVCKMINFIMPPISAALYLDFFTDVDEISQK